MVAIGWLDTRPADAKADGEGMYTQYCSMCHGADGSGYAAGNAVALANQDFLAAASDTFIRHAIEHGRPGKPMSAFGQFYSGPLALTGEDAIISFLRSKQTAPSVEISRDIIVGDIEEGRRIFSDRCANCHGPQGNGASAVSLDSPAFLASAPDAFIRHSVEHGRQGTPMRGYKDELVAADLDDVTALIRSWTSSLPAPPMPKRKPKSSVMNPDGVPPVFSDLQGGYLTPDAFKTAFDAGNKLVLLDARVASEWRHIGIPGSVSLPYYDAEDIGKTLKKVPTDTWVVCYGSHINATAEVLAQAVAAAGFQNVAVMTGGVDVWQKKRFPVDINEGPPPPP